MNAAEAIAWFKAAYFPHSLDELDMDLRADPEVVLAACRWGKGKYENLQYAAPTLLASRDFALQVADLHVMEDVLGYFSPELRDDADLVQAFVDHWRCGINIRAASERVKAIESVMLKALSHSGEALAFALPAQKKNFEYVMTAVGDACESIQFADPAFLEDRTLMWELVSRVHVSRGFLEKLPEKYRADREMVMAILASDYESFRFVDPVLRADPEVVWQAMFKCNILYAPRAFEYADAAVQRDKAFVNRVLAELKGFRASGRQELVDLVKACHKQAVAATKGDQAAAVEGFKTELKTLKKQLKEAGFSQYERKVVNNALQDLAQRLKAVGDNRTLMKQLLELDFLQKDYSDLPRGFSLQAIAPKLLNDRKFLAVAMEVTSGEVLGYLDPVWQDDAGFILENAAGKLKPEHVSGRLRQDHDFLLGLAHSLRAYEFKVFPVSSLWDDEAFVRALLSLDYAYLEQATPRWQRDRAIVELACQDSWNALHFADPVFYNDRELMGQALMANVSYAAENLREPLRSDVDFQIACVRQIESAGQSNVARELLRHAPTALREHCAFLIACLEKNGWGIESVPESLKYEEDILRAAFSSGAWIHKSLDIEILKQRYNKATLQEMIANPQILEALSL